MELLTQAPGLPGAFLSRCRDREGGRRLVKLSPPTQSLATAHTRILRSAPGTPTETEDKRRVWNQRTFTHESPRAMCLS